MAGKGKYTTYNTPASAKKTFFEKLFKGSPFAGMDQAAAMNPATDGSPVKLGNDVLRGLNFAGDAASGGGTAHVAKDGIIDTGTTMFGKVDLTFKGRGDSQIQPPDTHEGKDVTWQSPGDPANSFVPDVTSPGPGKVNGTDKDTNPDIKTTDIKPNFDPTKSSVNTASPSDTGSKVYDSGAFGKEQQMGKSGA